MLEWRQIRRGNISWADRHVFISGGSEGIGLALAKLFLEKKAVVSICSRSQAKLQAAQEYLTVQQGAASERVFTQAADVACFEQVEDIL